MSRTLRLYFEIGFFLLLSIAVALFYQQDSAQSSGVAGTLPQVASKAGRKIQLTVADFERTAPGYTLYPVSGTEEVLLLDTRAQVRHRWMVDADRARLLPNCNLLVIHGSKWGLRREPWEALRPVIREYDWDGNVVWEHTAQDIAHHDLSRLKNGNTLFLRRTMISSDNPRGTAVELAEEQTIRSDSVLEVTPQGETVWEWHAHDHLDLTECGRRGCRYELSSEKAAERMRDWTHMNTASVIPENRWYDGGDERFRPGNVIVLPRNWWEVMIIDRASSKVVWNYGGDYKGGIIRGHEAHIIPKGLPGAGNMLIFDNGVEGERKSSFILEINPVTKELVWVYDNGPAFFSRAAGSVQRLPNGNTFISEDVPGRVFEITPGKEIVWEIKNRYRIHRAQKYEAGYCPRLVDSSDLH